MYNSSCRQGDSLYTFGGDGGYGVDDMNLIERVNARLYTWGELNDWEIMALPDTIALPAFRCSVFLSINANELLILGGDLKGQRTGDAYLINVRSGEV